MKSVMESTRPRLWIAIAMMVLSSVVAAKAQQAQPQTQAAPEQPAIAAPSTVEHQWHPNIDTNSAIPDMNTRQPEKPAPGASKNQEPYLHTAVEEQHTVDAKYQNKNGTAPAMEKMVMVAPVDKRDFGSATQQMTIEGRIVIDVPDGWVRTDGPGLLYYAQRKMPKMKNPLRSYDASIYMGVAFINPNPSDEDSPSFSSADSFIHSDISGFRLRYKNGIVKEAESFPLPLSNARHVAYTFQSRDQDNGYEEVVYIDEGDRVFTLTLSAMNAKTFWSLVPVFQKFAQSYQGHIADGARMAVQ